MDQSKQKPFLTKLSVPQQNKLAEVVAGKSPAFFPNSKAARRFLSQIIFPPSLRWIFISTGKNASTSVLNWLFEQEFGTPLTVRVHNPIDINPASEVHALPTHGVFSRAVLQGWDMDHFTDPQRPVERLCVVRDPFDRAVSAFRYLCKSQKEQSQWFAPDRFKLNAFFCFDWTKDMDTAAGFELFLKYIQWQIELEGADAVNAHWMPQYTFIKPEIYQPTIIGRIEDMGRFYGQVAMRLGYSNSTPPVRKNVQITSAKGASSITDLYDNAYCRDLCKQIYRQDYETFGY